MLHRQRRGRRSRQSFRMTRSCTPPRSPALGLCRQWSGTNRDAAGRRRTSPASSQPVGFNAGLTDYVASMRRQEKNRSLVPHRPSRQAWVWWATAPPPFPFPSTQTGSDFTSTVRKLRTSVRVWCGAMRWSSASAASRASRISCGPRPLPSDEAVCALFAPSQVLCCVVPETWETKGLLELKRKPAAIFLSAPGTLLAGLPILSFLEHILTNVPLLYKGLEKNLF